MQEVVRPLTLMIHFIHLSHLSNCRHTKCNGVEPVCARCDKLGHDVSNPRYTGMMYCKEHWIRDINSWSSDFCPASGGGLGYGMTLMLLQLRPASANL